MKSEDDIEVSKGLGDRIKRVRQQRSLSQESLAELAGVHRTYIGMVERGEKNITVVTLRRLSKALAVSPAELLQEL